MKLYHIRTLDQLRPYRKEWDNILEANQNDNPFIEFQWVENWWRYLGANRAIEMIVVERGHDVIAFFPFQFTRRLNTTIIEFIACEEANYMDIVVYDHEREEVMQFVFDELMRSMPKCIFNLHGLLSSSPTTNLLKLYLEKKNCEPTIFSEVAPLININSVNLEDFINKRRKIHGLNRSEKRLGYLGEVKVETTHPNDMDQVYKLHDRHWKYRIDTSQFTEEAHKDFYSALVNLPDGPLQAKVDSLYLDQQMIAFSYGLICRGRYLCYQIGHDDDYGIYGPGTILDKELIGKSNSKSIHTYDLSMGYEPYKFEWNTGVDYVNTFMFSSEMWQSKMMFHLIRGKSYMMAALKKNTKLVLFKRHTIDPKITLLKHGKFRDWMKAVRNIGSKLYSRKSVDVYQQCDGQIEEMDYQLLVYPTAKKRLHNLSRINKQFYHGFSPYIDSKFSIFWFHPHTIRVEEVDYLKPLPKESAFIADWQIHKLGSICSFLRQEKQVQDIFLHTSKKDAIVTKHLKQLGFKKVNSIKKTSVLSNSTVRIATFEQNKV